ncbi:MarR family winged helix-turn-helix transcriptional regulator [Streptomyces avicenniae]|uniref:MarR family winged helix-turn-helix transcriptional regulator n=1 Tax=Streptomyces avicenniae TaxID=500153 RepID=UPI00069B5BD3|nr:MarR family transcriptional regulator [Streptomyces avicenniae]
MVSNSRPAPPATATGPGFPLADHTGYLLHKAGVLLLQHAERAMEPLGLRARPYYVLAALKDNSALSQQDLSRLLSLDPTTMVAVVDDLERRGLVERRRDTADRRRYRVGLTGAGRDLLARADRAVSTAEDEFFQDLTPGQRGAVHDALGTLLVHRRPDEVCG